MGKVIGAINMALDGFCNHDAINPDEQVHKHYADLLNGAGAIIYGRKTYMLMENYWPKLVKTPSGNKEIDGFALAMDKIPKVVFSQTLKSVNWKSARIAKHDIKKEVLALKQKCDEDIFVGSPSLIVQCMNLKVIDEFQIMVHPIVLGKGLRLFRNANKTDLDLFKTKKLRCGAVILYYRPKKPTPK